MHALSGSLVHYHFARSPHVVASIVLLVGNGAASRVLHIRPCLGARPIGAITQFNIQSLYAQMFNRGLSSRTIECTNAVLQSALRQAVRWKMLAEDPCVGVDLPPLKKREMDALSVEECKGFLTVARENEGFGTHALRRQLALVDNLAVEMGKHRLAFGIDFRRLSPQVTQAQYFLLPFFADVPSAEVGDTSAAWHLLTIQRPHEPTAGQSWTVCTGHLAGHGAPKPHLRLAMGGGVYAFFDLLIVKLALGRTFPAEKDRLGRGQLFLATLCGGVNSERRPTSLEKPQS